jgi:Trk K+ transport system NAD-binding subunit
MLTGKHYILCGLNALTLRVAEALLSMNATISVLITPRDNAELCALLGDGIEQLKTASESAHAALKKAGVLKASCVLILGEDDLTNLRFTIAVHGLAASCPVVLRAFDPVLADQFESGMNVRRAFSVSGLSAPAFAASACGSSVIETLRLGDDLIPISTTAITQGSELVGKSFGDISELFDICVIGWKTSNGAWQLHDGQPGDIRLHDGMEIAFGGPNTNCLHLATACNENLGRQKSPGFAQRIRSAAVNLSVLPGKLASDVQNSHQKYRRSSTWMPKLSAALLSIVLISIFVFKSVLHLSMVDAIYYVITTVTTTGYGDITVLHSSSWVKLFNGLIMLTGGALLGMLFSYLSAVATAERLDTQMSRRAQNMKDHIVVIGLGNVGYRTAKSLLEIGRNVVIMDASPRERFSISIGGAAPILRGDARQVESLAMLGIKDARAIIACTNDELVNVEACLHARRINPNVRTIARVFDETMAHALSSVFQIDKVLSSDAIAESAFVAAATDESVLRKITIGDLHFSAGRIRTKYPIAPQDVKLCLERGVRVLALKSADGGVFTRLKTTDAFEAIVYGPEEVLREMSSTEWQAMRPNTLLQTGVYNRLQK